MTLVALHNHVLNMPTMSTRGPMTQVRTQQMQHKVNSLLNGCKHTSTKNDYYLIEVQYLFLNYQNKMALLHIPLPSVHFIFLFLLFQFGVLIIITCGHLYHHKYHLCSITWCDQPISYHLEQRVSSLTFHQLSKIKLRLSMGQNE